MMQMNSTLAPLKLWQALMKNLLGFFDNFIDTKKGVTQRIQVVYRWRQNIQSHKLQWSIKSQIEQKEKHLTADIQIQSNKV